MIEWAPSVSGMLGEFQQWIRRNVRMLEVFPQWSFNETHQIWMRTEKYGLAGICPTGDSRVVWGGRWRAAEPKISIPKPPLAEWNNDTCSQTDKFQGSFNRMWKSELIVYLIWIWTWEGELKVKRFVLNCQTQWCPTWGQQYKDFSKKKQTTNKQTKN